jgi:23S rRNA U2552 (ribose-2'-O)-methylase RlmE/FtsJ
MSNISEKKLRARDKPAKDIGPLTKAAAYLSINLNTLADKTPSRISEMMIKGSTMGVIDMTKKLNEYSSSADPDVMDLAGSLLSFEQHNIEECKRFLQ